MAFARDPKHLGGEPAITMVLHTWGQTLTEHVHVHCVVTGGGLSAEGMRWVSIPRPRRRRPLLFPVKALSQMFRGKYLAALDRLHRTGGLHFAGQSAPLAETVPWQRLLSELRGTPWVVYAKPPFGGPARVLKYLSRYTHRVAIANSRILFVGAGRGRFRWKDYADHNATMEMTLRAAEFLRRFLLHVVPRAFMRIRHYGVLANRHRASKLARCRELLGVAASPPVSADLDAAGSHRQDDAASPKQPPPPRVSGLRPADARRRDPRTAKARHVMTRAIVPSKHLAFGQALGLRRSRRRARADLHLGRSPKSSTTHAPLPSPTIGSLPNPSLRRTRSLPSTLSLG